jgi:MFS family permease
VLLGAGIVGAVLLALSGAAVPRGVEAGEGPFENFFTERPRVVIVMWLNFVFLGLGGLIAVSHAAGIAVDYGLPESQTYRGAMLVNLGYIAGALSAGYLSELFGGRRVMIGMAVLTAAPLFLLYVVPSATISLITLTCLGVAFGAGTSCYPVTLAHHYGVARVPAILGRVCTAYGVAGLAAPFIAGALHDLNGNYTLAILIAAIVGVVGLLATLALPRPPRYIAVKPPSTV